MRFSVIISTYNRARRLEETLRALARQETRESWEAIVVDNNSTDDTRRVVLDAAAWFPVALRYIHEPTAGKYAAMNTGLAASRGDIIAATDDDACVDPDWLQRAAEGLERHACGFVGGRVDPLWDGPPPSWLDASSPLIRKVIALLDYGDTPREFGVGIGWPLGVNVAYRRSAFELAGPFDPSLGRKAGTLRSQSQREWHLRARAAGIRGFYVPDMRVQHEVVRERLEKQYFRRWYYWHGISRASLYYKWGFDPEEPEQIQHDQPIPHIFGMPRRLFPKALRAMRSWLWRLVRGDNRAFEYELWLCFFAGLAVQCRREWRHGFRSGIVAPAGAGKVQRAG
jgi:glycosyltransferase involved in cell wall biosynthesis